MAGEQKSQAESESTEADVKAQFLEALQRKQQHHADGVAGSGPTGSKIHEAHDRAATKRQFRRKSG
jgi:uncharacterized protein DUF5302